MAQIPSTNEEIVDRIYAAIEKKETTPFRLSRIGASGIGEECLRSIWYSWRGYASEKFDGRMMRLFRTGHLQENRIVDDLKLAGFQVWELDESTGEQWTYTDETGHFVAKLDGVMRGIPGAEKTPHTLEIKTHNKKSFDGVVKYGIFRAKPKHYAQIQSGFLLSGLNRALYVALCKDDERYYVERIIYDEEEVTSLNSKIKSLINSTLPPAKISEQVDSPACRFCKNVKVCKGGADPIRTCRSCQHVEVENGGLWLCCLTKNAISPADQLKACEHYEVIRG